MHFKKLLFLSGLIFILNSCSTNDKQLANVLASVKDSLKLDSMQTLAPDKFEYVSEQFADLRVLRYEVPGFNELPLKTKELIPLK